MKLHAEETMSCIASCPGDTTTAELKPNFCLIGSTCVAHSAPACCMYYQCLCTARARRRDPKEPCALPTASLGPLPSGDMVTLSVLDFALAPDRLGCRCPNPNLRPPLSDAFYEFTPCFQCKADKSTKTLEGPITTNHCYIEDTCRPTGEGAPTYARYGDNRCAALLPQPCQPCQRHPRGAHASIHLPLRHLYSRCTATSIACMCPP
jgi:hypothetical protein